MCGLPDMSVFRHSCMTDCRPCDRRARGPVRLGGGGRDHAVAQPYDQTVLRGQEAAHDRLPAVNGENSHAKLQNVCVDSSAVNLEIAKAIRKAKTAFTDCERAVLDL